MKAPGQVVVGFYLHPKCGDVAFWCTDWPTTDAPVSDADLALNGAQPMLGGWRQVAVMCGRCGRYCELRPKHFRAVPRAADLRRDQFHGRRAIALPGVGPRLTG